jgi:hypothetical protein
MAFPHDGVKFEAGQSGNPNGRPTGAVSVKAELRKLMDIILQGEINPLTDLPEDMPTGRKIALNLAMKAVADGDLGAIKTIMEHIDGKATERIEHSGTINRVVVDKDDEAL